MTGLIGRLPFLFGILIMMVGNTSSKSTLYDPCQVFGVLYIEDNPARAHFRVYEEDSEAFADVIVYEEQNRLYADKAGIWNFTDKREFADFFIYFEETKNLADFSVYFTDFESFAGCNR